MATTVQVDENVKQELLIIKARLEQLTGKRHTLSDAIRWLIERNQTLIHNDKNEPSESYFGILRDLDLSLNDVTQLRKERSSRIADF